MGHASIFTTKPYDSLDVCKSASFSVFSFLKRWLACRFSGIASISRNAKRIRPLRRSRENVLSADGVH